MDVDHGRLPPLIASIELPGEASQNQADPISAALRDILTSLEVPFDLTIALKQGPARLSVNEGSMPLDGDRFPWRDIEGLHATWRLAPFCITEEVVRNLWLAWSSFGKDAIPGEHLAAMRNILAEGAGLGFKTSRFADRLRSALPGDLSGRAGVTLLEDCISGPDCCTVRLYLSREQYTTSASPGVTETGSPKERWERSLADLGGRLVEELGLVLPAIGLAVDDNLDRNAWRIEWNDLRLPPIQGLQPGEVLAEDTPERLRLLGVDSTPGGQPTGRPAAIVLTKEAENCRSAGIRTWDRDELVLLMLETSIRRAAGLLVNRPLVELYLLRLRESEPDLVSSTLERFDASFLTRVVRDLLADGIPLDRFSQFLESMASLQATCEASEEQIVFPSAAIGTMFGTDKGVPLEALTAEDYADFIRWELKRFLSHKYAEEGKHLIVYLMEHSFEGRLASPPPLKPDERQRLLEAVRDELEELKFLPATSQAPVILTTARVRRALARELRLEFPMLSVIAYQELSPDLNIQPIARIDPSAYE